MLALLTDLAGVRSVTCCPDALTSATNADTGRACIPFGASIVTVFDTIFQIANFSRI